MQPKTHIAYTPVPPGAIFSMFYIESDIDIFGWCVQADEQQQRAAYFMLENYYVNKTTLLHRSVHADVSGQWTTDQPPAENIIQCPVPESLRHELERLQFEFIEHWLFFQNDPAAVNELDAYQKDELPVLSVNIKSKKVNRLSKHKIVWTYTTAGIDLSIVDYLQNHWQINDEYSR